jgi:hypothetical protein
MLSKILLISCFCSRIVFHGSPFLGADGTFSKLKSVERHVKASKHHPSITGRWYLPLCQMAFMSRYKYLYVNKLGIYGN